MRTMWRWHALDRLANVWEVAADPENQAIFKTVLVGVNPHDTAMVGYFVGRLCRDGKGMIELPPNPYLPHEADHAVWDRAFRNGLSVEDRHCPAAEAA